jgi:hypothetical protein
MRRGKKVAGAVAILAMFGLLGLTSVSAVDLGLVGLLTQKLGITEEQAKAGAGAIFNMAKEKLGAQDFGKVSAAVPEMDDLLKAAPAIGGLGSVVGGNMPTFGGGGEPSGGLSSLSSAFSGLGMQSDMMNKFVPVVLSYVESKGGPAVKNILAAVLN